MICTQYRVYFKPTRNFMESHPGETQSFTEKTHFSATLVMLRPSLVPMPPPKFTTRDPLSFALREGSQSGLHGKPCSAFDLLYIVIVIPLMDKIPALAQILHIYIYDLQNFSTSMEHGILSKTAGVGIQPSNSNSS